MKIFFAPILYFLFISNGFSQNLRYNQPDIILHNPPNPQFSCFNLCLGDTTKFINQSTGASTFFWWIYGSGSVVIDSSTLQDISFYFPSAGTYTVTLQADNGHIASISKIVTVGNITIADFSFQRCANNFNNMSACSNGFWWNFGDGGTSIDSLPTHQYADTGYYQVTLIANNGTMYDTIKKLIYVDEISIPDPAFTVSQSYDTLFYQLTNFMPYELIIFYFGDGKSDTLKSTQSYHIYQDTGTYVINVLVRNACGMRFNDTIVTIMFPLSGISNQNVSQQKINIYPNPANEVITIEADIECLAKITLFDMLGNSIFIVENYKLEKINKINLSKFSSGQYFIQVRTKSEVLIKKIVIE